MFAVDAHDMRTVYAVVTRREQILSWLRAHDLNPNHVWSTRVLGPLIRVREYRLDEQGRKFVRRGKPAMRTRWVLLREKPPALGNDP